MSYTLIAYRANSSVPACPRGCCGSDRYDSSHSVQRGLSQGDLVEKIARLKLEDEEYEGRESYDLTYFMDADYNDEDDMNEKDHIDDLVHYRLAQLKQGVRAAAEQKALEDAAAEAKAAEEKRIADEKAREEYERSELLRLQEKYKSQPAPLVGFPDGD